MFDAGNREMFPSINDLDERHKRRLEKGLGDRDAIPSEIRSLGSDLAQFTGLGSVVLR